MKEKYLVPLLVAGCLVAAGLAYALGNKLISEIILQIALVAGLLPLLWNTVVLIFKGRFGVDVIAITAIASSLALHQYWAGAVIILMMSSGEALEAYALSRASKELTHLLSKAPTIAHIKTGEELSDVPAAEVRPGNVIVIKPGESLPVDGVVIEGSGLVDESAMTGESVPVSKQVHSYVSSGSVNLDGVLTVKALKPASESQYERIIALVRQAQETRAPIVRLADRYSIWFTFITFAIAIAAYLVSHDPVRFLSVLVVATPCPLILATPIAVMSGISWTASRGIIVKSGGSLERLGEARSFVFDKTGTLTLGVPKVLGAASKEFAPEEIIFFAASLDQLSAHIFARSLVSAARKELKKELAFPEEFKEHIGDGVTGLIDGLEHAFGKLKFLQTLGYRIDEFWHSHYRKVQDDGHVAVYLGREGRVVGCVLFADVPRPEIKSVFHSMQHQGIRRVVMLTGDRRAVAEKIAAAVGVPEFRAECLPEQKVEELKKIQQECGPVAMVGDGVNDAPALAVADIGIALGASGSTAASDAGDIVITVNNMERVPEALYIARRVLHIARQGILFGIGVSILLMLIAAGGYILPVAGAIIQEVLDAVVIVNALRVKWGKRGHRRN